MRISNKMICDEIVYNLNRVVQDIKKINETIASGKRLNRPSDDPLSLVGALDLKATLSEINQYSKDIDFGYAWLATTETAIEGGMDLISRAKQLAVQMSTGTYSQDQRESVATEVNEILKELVRIANTEYRGEYVFAGYKSDTAPYALNSGETEVDYNGDTYKLEIRTGRNSRMSMGLYGSEVFGEKTLYIAEQVGTGSGTAGTFYLDYWPVVDNSETIHLTNELMGFGGGAVQTFYLDFNHIDGNSQRIYVGGTLQTEGGTGTYDYMVNDTTGVITFNNAPPATLAITADYSLSTEGTFSYTLDEDTGEITFISAPGTLGYDVSVTADYRADKDYAFSVLIRLRDALQTNDVEGIQEELVNLDTVYQRMATEAAEIGAKMNTLEMKRNILSDTELTTTERLSSLEDIDIVKAFTDLTMKQSAYQAALTAAAKVTQLSLADYL
jgi:flagellar hook-associated protein 3 FlgL